MTTGKPEKKGLNVIGAITDFLILVLLVGAAGGGGYYWGTIQRMAPVQAVGAGTPGALPEDSGKQPPKQGTTSPASSTSATPSSTSSSSTSPSSTSASSSASASTSTPAATATPKQAETDKKTGPTQYWVCSSGKDYIGYQIFVSVNGTQIDSFYGPDKLLKITSHMKPGKNTILFDAKMLGAKFNKHKGDEKATLTLKLVSGPKVQDSFPDSDVISTFTRNATETEDFKEAQTVEKVD